VAQRERSRRGRREELDGAHLARFTQRVQPEYRAGDVDAGEDENAADQGQRLRVGDGTEQRGSEDNDEREQRGEPNGEPQPAQPQSQGDRQRTRPGTRRERPTGSAGRVLTEARRVSPLRGSVQSQQPRRRGVGEPQSRRELVRHGRRIAPLSSSTACLRAVRHRCKFADKDKKVNKSAIE